MEPWPSLIGTPEDPGVRKEGKQFSLDLTELTTFTVRFSHHPHVLERYGKFVCVWTDPYTRVRKGTQMFHSFRPPEESKTIFIDVLIFCPIVGND